jgi:hypothetical protein
VAAHHSPPATATSRQHNGISHRLLRFGQVLSQARADLTTALIGLVAWQLSPPPVELVNETA